MIFTYKLKGHFFTDVNDPHRSKSSRLSLASSQEGVRSTVQILVLRDISKLGTGM